MFVKKIAISNYRLFGHNPTFELDELNVPNGEDEGSGLTVFVGENGCGKTALLEAFALPLLSYKADSFSLHDINDPNEAVQVEVISSDDFKVDKTIKGSFQSKGFRFEAKIRARSNTAYLSSIIVSDRKYIKSDSEVGPKDESSDLRVNVNNPFKRARFDENEILFLDKNRVFQTRSGTYNPTRFDRLMEDFDYQYIKGRGDERDDLNAVLDGIKKHVDNEFLKEIIAKFGDISGSKVVLSFIDNWRPFEKCFFAEKRENQHQVPLGRLGSGYEMIFALLYAFYLSRQSGKQLIVLIDEPELHFHPALQERFVQVVLEFSRSSQVILSTHSPLLVRNLLVNEMVKANVLVKGVRNVQVLPVEQRLLPFVSASEINYLAFDLASEEYHNELYEELKYLRGDDKGIKDFDIAFFQREKGEIGNHAWKGAQNQVSLHTFVRNQIHHQKENGKAAASDLKVSIDAMRKYLRELAPREVPS